MSRREVQFVESICNGSFAEHADLLERRRMEKARINIEIDYNKQNKASDTAQDGRTNQQASNSPAKTRE